MEHIKGNCPHCAKPLEIPEGLEEFSCLYCGVRTSVAQMLACQSASQGQYEAELAYLKENLPLTVTRYPDHFRKMTRKDFVPAFEDYEAENAQIVNRLDTCARLNPKGREACMQEVCKEFLDELDAHLKAQPKWEKESKRQDMLFAVRVVLAIFLTPLVRKLRLETAEVFRAELNRQWLERWPTQKWTPGDYEVLEAGYRKRGLCFITSATCEYEKKADDCEELTAFRTFRDGWLSENGYHKDIELYYEIAPAIVQCIDYCDDSEKCYAQIREKWLQPCYRALQEERNEDCRRAYTEMVRTLQAKYLQ